MATILWHATEAEVEINPTAITLASDESIDTAMGDESAEYQYQSMVKDLTIRGGDRDVEALKLLGYNEVIDEKRSTLIECTFTTAYQGSVTPIGGTRQTNYDFAELFMGQKQAVTGDYYRSQGGEKSSNDRVACAVHVKLTDGTHVVSILLNSAYATSRELSVNADGHMEQTITFKCLASTYYEEDNYAS